MKNVVTTVKIKSVVTLGCVDVPLRNTYVTFDGHFNFGFKGIHRVISILLVTTTLLVTFSASATVAMHRKAVVDVLFFPPDVGFICRGVESSTTTRRLSVSLS